MPVAAKHSQGCRPLEFHFPPAGRGALNRERHVHNNLLSLSIDILLKCWPASHAFMGRLVCKRLRRDVVQVPQVVMAGQWDLRKARKHRSQEGVGLFSGAQNFLGQFAGKPELKLFATSDATSFIESSLAGTNMEFREASDADGLDLFLDDFRCFFTEMRHARERGWKGASALHLSLPVLEKLPKLPSHDTGGVGNAFVASMTGMTSLQALCLDYCNYEDPDFNTSPVIGRDQLFRETLPTLSSLTTLRLCESDIDIEGLAAALEHCTRITTLDLSRSFTMGRQPLSPLTQALTKLSKLSYLNLDGFGLGSEEAADLAEALPHLPSLKRLQLSENQISDDAGALKLAQSVGLCASLEMFISGRVSIASDSPENRDLQNLFGKHLRELTNALQLCPKLSKITLQEDLRHAEHGACVAKMLSNCSALRTFGIYDCLVEPDAALKIAASYPDCKNLTSLEFVDLILDDDMYSGRLGTNPGLLSSLHRLPALAKLSVQSQSIEAAHALLEVLPKCTTLKTVDCSLDRPTAECITRFCQALASNGRNALDKVYIGLGISDDKDPEGAEAMLDRLVDALETAGVRTGHVSVGEWVERFGEEEEEDSEEEEG